MSLRFSLLLLTVAAIAVFVESKPFLPPKNQQAISLERPEQDALVRFKRNEVGDVIMSALNIPIGILESLRKSLSNFGRPSASPEEERIDKTN